MNKKSKSKKVKSNRFGGADNVDEPNGGFPPIYLCDIKDKEQEASKNREYVTHASTVSIKDIMKKRRATTPLVPGIENKE